MKTAPEGAGVLNHCVECQIRFERFAITTAAAFSAAVLSSRSLKGSKPAARVVVREISASVGFSAPRCASTVGLGAKTKKPLFSRALDGRSGEI